MADLQNQNNSKQAEKIALLMASFSRGLRLRGEVHDILQKHDCLNVEQAVLEALTPELTARPELTRVMVEHHQELSPNVLSVLTPKVLRADPEALLAIDRAAGSHAESAFRNAPRQLLLRRPDVAVALAQACGSSTGHTFYALPWKYRGDRAEQLLPLAQHYGKSFWGLLARYGGNIEKCEKRDRPFLENVLRGFGEGAGEGFVQLGPDVGTDDLNWLTGKFGSAAPRIYGACGHMSNVYAHCGEHSLPARIERHWREGNNIRHIERYCRISGTTFVPNLLQEIAYHCDPQTYKSRALSVIITAESDYNRAFASYRHQQICNDLLMRTKTLVYEAGTIADVERALHAAAGLHGFNERGEPLKKIDNLVIRGHGHWSGILLSQSNAGKRSVISGSDVELNGANSLNVHNVQQLAQLFQRYLAPGAVIVISSCRTAKGGAEARNLATAIHALAPHCTVIAWKQVVAINSVELGHDGRIIDAHGVRDENIKVRLAARPA